MCLLRDVSKGAIAVVAIEHHTLFAGDEQVGPLIIVVISNCASHCPAGITDTGLVRDVRERAIVIVSVERAFRLFALCRHLDGGRIGEKNIEPAVAIVVEEQNSSGHGFDQVFLFWRHGVLKRDAGCHGDVRKMNGRCKRRFPGRFCRWVLRWTFRQSDGVQEENTANHVSHPHAHFARIHEPHGLNLYCSGAAVSSCV